MNPVTTSVSASPVLGLHTCVATLGSSAWVLVPKHQTQVLLLVRQALESIAKQL